MSNYTNEDIKNALQDVKNGLSQRKAASRNGVPRQTLRDRIAGALPHSEAHKHQQKLSEAQEQYLRDWILVQGAIGFPPTHIQVREFAQRIARKNGYDEPIGRHWIKNFLARHKEIKTHRSRKIDTARFNGATTDRIKAFFQLLQLPAIKDIPKENRYNMDECGVMEGQGHNGLVLGNAEKSVVLQKNPGSRIWTTIVECISADGRALTPSSFSKAEQSNNNGFLKTLTFLALGTSHHL
jgi:4-hydroxybenzoate polyprenyltransferase